MSLSALLPYATLALALYGAALSTINAFVQNRPRLTARASVQKPHTQLVAELLNPSPRRFVVKRAKIRYGIGPHSAVDILEIPELSGCVLEIGAGTSASVGTNDLRTMVKTNSIIQHHYCRLWLVVETFSGRGSFCAIEIDNGILSEPDSTPARHYRSADALLGLKSGGSQIYDYSKIK